MRKSELTREKQRLLWEDIKRLFYDEEELWSGIINTVQVRITKVNMSSDYYFENGPEYGGGDGYE